MQLASAILGRHRQRGAVLVIGLVFLGVITVLSVTAMRAGILGVRMSQNEESRFAAIQVADALTDAVIAAPGGIQIFGNPGFTVCTAGEVGCDIYGVPLPAEVQAIVDTGYLSGRVERLDPAFKPPPRILESSLDSFSVASFEVTSTFDRSAESMGMARVVQGVLVLTPN